LLLFQ